MSGSEAKVAGRGLWMPSRKNWRFMAFFVFILLSAFCFFYFVLMQVASPGTFLATIFGFSALWLYAGIFFLVLAVLQKKKLLVPFIKKIRLSVKLAFCFCAGILFLIFGINLFFICNPRLADGSEDVKYVIVLGGGITKDAQLTTSVQKRVKTAADYLKKHEKTLAVVTGGKGKFSPCPESDVLKPALESYGIEKDRVLAENKAKDTIENFLFSVKLISEKENISVSDVLNANVAVVTSDFHLARAERLSKRMGFKNVYGVASKTPLIFVLNSYMREICCYVKLNLRILLTGKPVNLQEN